MKSTAEVMPLQMSEGVEWKDQHRPGPFTLVGNPVGTQFDLEKQYAA